MNASSATRRTAPIPGLAASFVVMTATAAAAAATPAAAPPASPQWPAPPANGEMGFVISTFGVAVYPGKDACPSGLSPMVRDNFLTTVSAEERERLQKPENEPELTQRWKAYGFSPDKRMNVCANYDKFDDHPLYKMVQSKVAYGVNLEDATGAKAHDPYVCPHEKFVSPAGAKGIDNQYYRAVGCERNWRAADGGVGADMVIGYKNALMSDYTIVMLLRNVHSFVRDDNVEVILATSPDKPIADTKQNFIRNASYQVTPNPHWRNVLHGHIINGVLTTDPADIVLQRQLGNKPRVHTIPIDWDFDRSRLQLTLKPDGTVDGILGGYVPLITFMFQQIGGGPGSVVVADIDCASQFLTIKAMADGERDPKTNQCHRISTAMHVEAVPAFVFDHTTTTAQAK